MEDQLPANNYECHYHIIQSLSRAFSPLSFIIPIPTILPPMDILPSICQLKWTGFNKTGKCFLPPSPSQSKINVLITPISSYSDFRANLYWKVKMYAEFKDQCLKISISFINLWDHPQITIVAHSQLWYQITSKLLIMVRLIL